MVRSTLRLLLALSTMMAGCGYRAGGVNIWDAVESGNVLAIKQFAHSGGDLNVRSLDGSTPLWIALNEENRASYEALLMYGADPNVIMSGRRVVTHWAALKSDPWWLRLALEHGADPNLINEGTGRPSEKAPIFFAIGASNLATTKLLVEHGADIDKPDRFGRYPLSGAAVQNDFEIVLFLLDEGADYTVAECRGVPFLATIREKVGYAEEVYKLQEDRKRLNAVRRWLEERGVDFPEN